MNTHSQYKEPHGTCLQVGSADDSSLHEKQHLPKHAERPEHKGSSQKKSQRKRVATVARATMFALLLLSSWPCERNWHIAQSLLITLWYKDKGDEGAASEQCKGESSIPAQFAPATASTSRDLERLHRRTVTPTPPTNTPTARPHKLCRLSFGQCIHLECRPC